VKVRVGGIPTLSTIPEIDARATFFGDFAQYLRKMSFFPKKQQFYKNEQYFKQKRQLFRKNIGRCTYLRIQRSKIATMCVNR
jgi:hypothetical protein